jgi:hypothetical protein
MPRIVDSGIPGRAALAMMETKRHARDDTEIHSGARSANDENERCCCS